MNQTRRTILRGTVSSTLLSVAVAAGLLRSGQVAASGLSETLKQNLLALQQVNPEFSPAIRLLAPEVAENGASVYIDFSCDLPEVDSMVVFVDRNPQPMIAAFQIAPEVVPSIQMRIKVAQTGQVWVMARSAGTYFKTAKLVKVTKGGCGVGVN
jgi:sulfur-oxidizing protein SoxY